MLQGERFALLIDGGFATKVLKRKLCRFPTADDIEDLCARIGAGERLQSAQLFRAYFYDCEPLAGKATNPLDGQQTNLANTQVAREHHTLLDSLRTRPDFAVRTGELVFRDWKLGQNALRSLRNGPRAIEARDLVPNIKQKGVDLRIGIDLASLAYKRIVNTVVLVSGDSDLIPAMKMARIEGLRVYLECLGQPVRPGLKIHCDVQLDTDLDS